MQTFSSFSGSKFKYDLTSPAYWISPKGEMSPPTPRHIGAIIADPEFFGESAQTIRGTFEDHGETISDTMEGQAREEIMLRVLKRGFIRIREIRMNYTVQVDKTDSHIKENIWAWARALLKSNPKQRYAEATIMQLHNNRKQKLVLDDIAMIGDVLIEEKQLSVM